MLSYQKRINSWLKGDFDTMNISVDYNTTGLEVLFDLIRVGIIFIVIYYLLTKDRKK